MHSFSSKADELKKLFALLKDLAEDVVLEFLPDGIHISTMDSMHTMKIDCHLYAQTLLSYECPERRHIGVKLLQLHIVFNQAHKDALVSVAIEPHSTLLCIRTEHNDELQRCSETKLTLIDMEHIVHEIKIESWECELLMRSSLLANVVQEVSVINDSVELCAEGSEFSTEQSNTDGTSHRVTLKPLGSSSFELHCSAPLRLSFSVPLLLSISRAACFKGDVRVRLGAQQPGYFEFAFGLGQLQFYVAPRISNDD
jgi:proliferating cell nuclear antigen PCNA